MEIQTSNLLVEGICRNQANYAQVVIAGQYLNWLITIVAMYHITQKYKIKPTEL